MSSHPYPTEQQWQKWQKPVIIHVAYYQKSTVHPADVVKVQLNRDDNRLI